MLPNQTDKSWAEIGERMPYFGVIPADEFRPEAMDADARELFFNSGEKHVSMVFDWIRHYFDEDFQPARCLDFGCGVGRLVVALARKAPEVVGVDISKGMIEEARRNCQEFGLSNVEFVESDDDLSKVTGKFDLIHSYIVLQHIAVPRGERIFRSMLKLLNDGGVGFVQFTYAETPGSSTERLATFLRQNIPGVNGLINLAKGRDLRYPYVSMNSYDVNRLLQILQENGFDRMIAALTQHSRDHGMALIFQKTQQDKPPTFFVE